MSGFTLTPGSLRRSTNATAPRGRVEGAQFGSWLAWLAAALRTISTRRALTEMDARMLQDIGVSRGDALIEASRAPWDLGQPRHRR